MAERALVMSKNAVSIFGSEEDYIFGKSLKLLRLPVMPQPTFNGGWNWLSPGPGDRKGLGAWRSLPEFLQELAKLCPYGQPGDILWIKEAWRALSGYNALKPDQVPAGSLINWEAAGDSMVAGRYRHAPTMPRWASRFVLEITSVRVQRAWSMTEAGAIASGIRRTSRGFSDGVGGLHVAAKGAYRSYFLTARPGGKNQAYSWHANPLLWVIGVERRNPYSQKGGQKHG